MSTSISESDLLEAVRGSSSDTRTRLLRELLADYVERGGRWPMPISGRTDEVLAYLFPRPGGYAKTLPRISTEREAELNERLNHLDAASDLRDYIAKLDSAGGSG